MIIKIKQFALFCGDIFLLYGALFLMILVRYGHVNRFLFDAHFVPFSAVFLLWLGSFYAMGLYDIRGVKTKLIIVEQTISGILTGTILAIVTFYAVPYFHISPKRNLIIFAGILAILVFVWRWIFLRITRSPQKRVLLVGDGADIVALAQATVESPHLGYVVVSRITQQDATNNGTINALITEKNVNTIIVDQNMENADGIFENIYSTLARGIEVLDVVTAYEIILRKVPLSAIQHLWVATNISRSKKIYETLKRPTEFVVALFALVALSPLLLLTALAIVITSRGPALYAQLRVGKNQALFTIYKFRTMINGADAVGPHWTEKNDQRVTPIGRILRATHIDELPQLWNIVRGDIGFVGPRPESVELVKQFKEKIPYYDVRHLIKPGVTGWAQTNYKPSASLEEAYEKLQYDIYYLKNTSPILDILILMRTIKLFFTELT
ncbi:MAG: exopolysaccharide biosynthesis polyprenyl glycosylphosphotransferase [Candidatus Paceibacterota bacterium]|jgi:exopolysaccharide biosynthesis polyprenyl glycosylphosphotransferase